MFILAWALILLLRWCASIYEYGFFFKLNFIYFHLLMHLFWFLWKQIGDIAAAETALASAHKIAKTLPSVWFFFTYMASYCSVLFSYCDLRAEARAAVSSKRMFFLFIFIFFFSLLVYIQVCLCMRVCELVIASYCSVLFSYCDMLCASGGSRCSAFKAFVFYFFLFFFSLSNCPNVLMHVSICESERGS